MPVLLFMRWTSVTTNRSRRKAVDPPGIRTFTQGLLNALLRVAQVGGHRFVLDTETLADLKFLCVGCSDSLLGGARLSTADAIITANDVSLQAT
jgi:hypothetical protein